MVSDLENHALISDSSNFDPLLKHSQSESEQRKIIAVIVALIVFVGIGAFFIGRKTVNTTNQTVPIPTMSSVLVNTGVKCTKNADCQNLPCSPVGYCPIFTCQQGYCYEDDSPRLSITPIIGNNDIANWKTYTSDTGEITMKHPIEVVVGNENAYTTFVQWGPSQQEYQTHFSDGIYILIKTESLNGQTLSAIVNKEVENSKQVGEVLMYPNDVSIAGISGLQYRASGLAESTHYFFPLKNDSYLEIINATIDPSNQGFYKTVEQMFSTLQITN